MTQWEVPTEEAKTAALASPRTARDTDATEEDDKAAADYAAGGKRKNRQVIMAESYDPSAAGKVEVKRIEKPESAKYVASLRVRPSCG